MPEKNRSGSARHHAGSMLASTAIGLAVALMVGRAFGNVFGFVVAATAGVILSVEWQTIRRHHHHFR
jgi:hypothetical protein